MTVVEQLPMTVVERLPMKAAVERLPMMVEATLTGDSLCIVCCHMKGIEWTVVQTDYRYIQS